MLPRRQTYPYPWYICKSACHCGLLSICYANLPSILWEKGLYLRSDKLFAKNQVSENSLIKSSFDSDFGTFFFDAYFQNMVLNLVETINNGGHFMCTRVYQKDSVFHFVTHLYNDLTLRIDDWQLAVVDNEIKIQDGFFYNLSSSMINDLHYWMLYQIMEIGRASCRERVWRNV